MTKTAETKNSNRLTILAKEIEAAHKAIMDAERTSLAKARQAGKQLSEAKKLLGHGKWLPWLNELDIEPRTAQRYMQIAGLDDDKYDTVSHLGIRDALATAKASKSKAAKQTKSQQSASVKRDQAGLRTTNLGAEKDRIVELEAKVRELEAVIEQKIEEIFWLNGTEKRDLMPYETYIAVMRALHPDAVWGSELKKAAAQVEACKLFTAWARTGKDRAKKATKPRIKYPDSDVEYAHAAA